MYATAAAAGSAQLPSDRVMDGVDLIPHITGIDTRTLTTIYSLAAVPLKLFAMRAGS